MRFSFYLTKLYRLLLIFFILHLHIYVLARIWRKKINIKKILNINIDDITNGNRNEWSLIQSVIIQVINK